ncbi:AfsR/SARP family transcriptional regulator [Pseudonocardia nigra]|uniref:AfsR/SARP family transcriptional regulator n=1 Tax=Pseudonocardia nigra TaxID=1921578 RepID=UPI001C5EDCA1|nr:BTAD domain-containing putative transcriptional regulator [Pseudonocardia nigra]
MRFLVLGPLAVERAGQVLRVTGRRELVVLAGLLAHRNESVPVTRLARLVWGPDGEPSRNALQARVSHLRRTLTLESERLTFVGDGYRLAVGAGESDDQVLADAVGQAQALLAAGQAAAARELLDGALVQVRGEPYAPVGEHAFALAAATRARELVWSARELQARAALEAGDPASAGALAAALVTEQPLRQDARAVLMQSLDAQGRRAEALATYDDGRRQLAAATGLEPSAALRAVHAEILHTERARTHTESAGPGVLEPPEMIGWLARNGHLDAALRLAVRCAWGWWLAGDRGRGRRLLLDLLADAESGAAPDGPATRAARLWAAALACHERDEALALADADAAAPADPGEFAALAMVLLADRRTERGEHDAAAKLLDPALAALRTAGDRWGIALADLVTARRHLLLGAIDAAEELGHRSLAVFQDLPDPAGQLAALDLLGYAAEVRGDWRDAADQHQRALLLALHGGWPHAQCMQLMRLGSVLSLAGQVQPGRQRLVEALAIARRIDSPSMVAFIRNILAMADARAGDTAAAAHHQTLALQWYRRVGSVSGVAHCSAVLARVSPPGRAEPLLEASWTAALRTRNPRAVAFSAESRALLAAAPATAAYHLGVADGLRAATGRPRVRGEQPEVDRLTDRLAGSAEHARGLREGGVLARRLARPVTPAAPPGTP